MADADCRDALRSLPKVDALLADPRFADAPHDVVAYVARDELNRVRQELREGSRTDVPDVAQDIERGVRDLCGVSMRPVINATGVVVHTNLGRAPWSRAAVKAGAMASQTCDLELRLEDGRRGGRLDAVERKVCALTGAQRAIVVNNCAAAVLLAVTALARDRQVLVSRGELVEIGGSFRVPDVVACGGAQLVEVGTTNRTRPSDFARALTAETAAILVVHRSNFRQVGFTETANRADLVALARANGLPVIEDVGSGHWEPHDDEPSVREVIAADVDVVTWSGDKLVGGPQAGFVAGRAEVVDRLRRHPMYRALRLDKVALAAIEATLAATLRGEPNPVQAMMRRPLADLKDRATRASERLQRAGVRAVAARTDSVVGGGALPGQPMPSWGVCVACVSAHRLAMRLRTGTPSVVGRVVGDALWLDMRTVDDGQLDAMLTRVADAVAVE